MSKQTWISEAKELFGEMREMTQEEAENYSEALDKIYTNIGISINEE